MIEKEQRAAVAQAKSEQPSDDACVTRLACHHSSRAAGGVLTREDL